MLGNNPCAARFTHAVDKYLSFTRAHTPTHPHPHPHTPAVPSTLAAPFLPPQWQWERGEVPRDAGQKTLHSANGMVAHDVDIGLEMRRDTETLFRSQQ